MELITIRKATLIDLPTLLHFEQGVIQTERHFDSTLKEGDIHYYDLKTMISSPDVELVVAESGTKLIGCGYARIETAKHYLKHRLYAYLGFMYVDPAHRGKGVNQLIVNALKDWAVSKGLTEIRLEVYNENTAAIRAYEKAGFTRYILEMRMSANDDQHDKKKS